MSERLEHLSLFKVLDWVIASLLDVNSEERGVAEEEMVSIQKDIVLKPKFKKSNKDFWKKRKKKKDCYPLLWIEVEMCFITLPTSCLVERSFSVSRLAPFKAKKDTRLLNAEIYDSLVSASLICEVGTPAPSTSIT